VKYLIGLTLVLVAGCTPSASEKVWPVLPDGLKDCKFYELMDSSGNTMKIARCPASTTTMNYKMGKAQATTITIDGEEYTKK